MAARMRKTHQDDVRFYVYAFDDDAGCVYVGKGSGRRFNVQTNRFAGCVGRIIDYFQTERAAYEAEKRYIAKLKPALNVHPGGNGCRVKIAGKSRRKDFWARNFEKIGSQRYAALLLLAAEQSKPGIVDPSKIDAIRQVAHGCRV
jgi:hypothetical protein